MLLGEVRRQHVVEYAICQLPKEIPNNEMSRASHKCTTQQLLMSTHWLRKVSFTCETYQSEVRSYNIEH